MKTIYFAGGCFWGVETKEQYEFLKENGCDVIQGYYFSRPLPLNEFEQLVFKGGK